jgi:ribosome-binding protein aMBF1 (putative translation factor)
MRTPARIVAWLLPLLLVGCTHNTTQVQPLAPPIVDAPLPQPSTAPKDLPPPVVSVPAQPAPVTNTTATAQTEPPPKPPAKHKKPAPPQPTQQASTESSGVSAIGQLSSPAPSDLRQQTSSSIAATERGLNGITRPLSDQEQKTATQIREFLKQAREALNLSDVDGAQTLAIKAKVLLSELTQ